MTKLKFSDIKSKSKILLSVYWSKLSSNDLPYLSVSIEQVRFNGENVDWKDQKAAIKLIDPEFSELVNFHLYDPNGYGMHFIPNNLYYFEQLRNDIFNLTLSKESFKALQDQQLENYLITFKPLKRKDVKYWGELLMHIEKENSNDRAFINMLIRKYSLNTFIHKSIFTALSRLKDIKSEYHIYEKKISKAKARSEIWGIQKYSNHTGIDQSIIKELLLDADYKNKLTKILTSQTLLNKVRLQELTNKFNLTTIKG
jgi:hypothetical protein